jgi:hypothetical protein
MYKELVYCEKMYIHIIMVRTYMERRGVGPSGFSSWKRCLGSRLYNFDPLSVGFQNSPLQMSHHLRLLVLFW